jgi:hypothetical protein
MPHIADGEVADQARRYQFQQYLGAEGKRERRRKIHTGIFHNVYYSLNIIKMIKSKRMR